MMRVSGILERVKGTGRDRWEVYYKARERLAAGETIIDLTIGEPDCATPAELVDATCQAMRHGRTHYAESQGEPGLRAALADYYTKTRKVPFSPEQFLCFPGTQTSLFTVIMAVAESGDEILVPDPMYATYEGVIQASGARLVPVPLRADHGFCLNVDDLNDYISPKTAAILLTTPHNPTGALLTEADIANLAALACRHDLWLISDEVYEALVFDGHPFFSPLSHPDLRDRTIAVSSISKSHAATGFRSGWCVGPEAFIDRLLPFAEAMLFGNQPFIADMTEKAIRGDFALAKTLSCQYARRAAHLVDYLAAQSRLKPAMPQGGMFVMIDVSDTGLSGRDYAFDLLDQYNVAVMPGSAFGSSVANWVRVALTVDDATLEEACKRIKQHAQKRQG